jgi:probable HAF family extracellular repeat protein
MRQITFALVAALGIAAPAAFAAAATVHYRVTVLPALDGSVAANSRGKSINDLGLVAGYSNASNGKRHATAWAFGRKLDLGTLGGAPDLASLVAWPSRNLLGMVSGISLVDDLDPNGGQGWSCAAGGFLANPGGHACHGFVWAFGRMHDLPPLAGGNNSFATGTNGWGQTVGWAESGFVDGDCLAPQVQQFRPVVWGPDHRPRALPLVDGDTSGSATAINDRGQIVGISGICDQAVGRSSARHAVMWENGGLVRIDNPNGAPYWNTPMALTERGDVAGFAGVPGDFDGNFTRAFTWSRATGWKWIDFLPGDVAAIATGINLRGQVVGYSNDGAVFHPWIWQNGQVADLDGLVDRSNGFDGTLNLADDINDFGVITGRATAADGSRIAFVATPIAH